MLDIKLLRENIQNIADKLATRGYKLDVNTFNVLESRRRELQSLTQKCQEEKNKSAKAIGQAKAKGEKVEHLFAQQKQLSDDLTKYNDELHNVQQQLSKLLFDLPNLPHETTPIGSSEDENIEVRKWGEPHQFKFNPKTHYDLTENSGMDFVSAAKLSGARFVILRGKIARLHRALAQFMLDMHVEHGYEEVNVPLLVKKEVLIGTGQLPKFSDDQFATTDEDFWLVPTAEVPVTNIVREQILDYADLPLKFVCHSPCFRKEAGTYGKDMRGMLRQHQFEKVELVQIVDPDNSYRALEELTGHAETILQKLELPYRVMSLCTGDIGISASKTYDLEVWLPSQNRYREISSCSNTESYQARRMQARFRNPATNKPECVHTLNGSGIAVGRALIAVIENYQTADGKINIPKVLQPYMQGISQI